MSNFIQLACTKLSGSHVLKAANQLLDATEEEELFEILFQKQAQFIQKKAYFSKKPPSRLVVVTNPTNLQHVAPADKGIVADLISEEEMIASISGQKFDFFDESVVLLTNNNVAKIGIENMAVFAANAKTTIIAIHDYDNHHWLNLSLQLSIIADIYFPAHFTDLSLISRLTHSTHIGIPTGSIQWKRKFIHDRLGKIISTERSDLPLGKHYFYGRFKYRNKILKTIEQHYPTVGLLNSDFHSRNAEDRFNEWVDHKLHWISPVFGDLPIRFFDALITGGLPLVPVSLEIYLNYLKIPSRFYCTYSAEDIISPQPFIGRAIQKFDTLGVEGIAERTLFCLQNFHVDEIVRQIFSQCQNKFGPE